MLVLRILFALIPIICVLLVVTVGKPFVVLIAVIMVLFATWLFFDVSKDLFKEKV